MFIKKRFVLPLSLCSCFSKGSFKYQKLLQEDTSINFNAANKKINSALSSVLNSSEQDNKSMKERIKQARKRTQERLKYEKGMPKSSLNKKRIQ